MTTATARGRIAPITTENMRGWYRHRDLLGLPGEMVIPESSSLEETVTFVERTAGLVVPSPVTG